MMTEVGMGVEAQQRGGTSTRFSSTETGGNLFGCRMAKLGEFLGITPRQVKEHM